MKKLIKVLPALAAILLGTNMAFAQSTNSYLIP
jgi:hypothetical protein